MKRTHKATGLIIIAALAVLARLLPYAQVFGEESIRFLEGDNYLHMRKVMLQLREFPAFVSHDYFVGYPQGTANIKPPLIDYAIAGASLLIGMGDPDVRLVETVAAVAPVLVGGATAILVCVVGARLFGPAVGLLAGLFLAFMPAHMGYTFVGRPDNEMMEPLMVAWMLLAYTGLQASQTAGRRRRIGAALATGVVALATLLFWRGSTLWIGIVALGAAADITADTVLGRRDSTTHSYAALAFLFLAGLLAALCGLNIFGNMRTFSFGVLSWFHVAAFSGIGLMLFLYGSLCSFWLEKGWGRLSGLAVLASLVCAVAIVASVLPPLRDNLSGAAAMLGFGVQDAWIESILEYRPLYSGGLGNTLKVSGGMFGWGGALLPATLAYLGYEQFRDGLDRGKLFFILFAALALVLGLARLRFIHVLALFVAISSGWLVHRSYLLFLSNSGFSNPRARRVSAGLMACVLFVLLFHPPAVVALRIPRTTVGNPINRPVMEAMLWIRDNTPAPEDVYDPDAMPPYSVMAIWNHGSSINYVAERPSVSTMYGLETFGMRESAAFYTATDAAEAEEILEATGAKYVLVHDLRGMEKTFAEIAGREEVDYTRPEAQLDLVTMRLFVGDGVGLKLPGLVVEALDHYRLVYESPGISNLGPALGRISILKLFEHLPGADVRVTARPGSVITATATIRTNLRRTFEFGRSARVGADGTARFSLPYAVAADGETMGLAGSYRIAAGKGSTAYVRLEEEDVLQGRRVDVNLE